MTDQQEATLRALEQGVHGMPDARPVNVEAKDIRALTTLARNQQSQITTLTDELATANTQHANVLLNLSEAREQISRLQAQPDA